MLSVGFLLRHLPKVIVLTLLATAVWAHLSVLRENTRLTTENAALSQSVAALEQRMIVSLNAARAEAERAEDFRIRSEELSGHIETLLKGAIPDAPLDPALIELLGGLRPR